jgi:hypothetical protein
MVEGGFQHHLEGHMDKRLTEILRQMDAWGYDFESAEGLESEVDL